MSCDTWGDCPVCGKIESVALYRDYTLNKDGTITLTMEGDCRECGQSFKSN